MSNWINKHPQQEGYYWYWHPDFQDPFPMRVVRVRSDTECRWEHDPDRYPCEDGKEWWKGPLAPIDGPEPPEKPSRSSDEVYHDDVLALLGALDLGTYARPQSPHAVMQDEVLPAVRRLREALEKIADADVDPKYPSKHVPEWQRIASKALNAAEGSDDG